MREVQGPIPDRGRVIPKTLKSIVPVVSLFSTKSKHWLFLNSQNSQIANSKNTIFEALLKIDYVVTMSDKLNKLNIKKNTGKKQKTTET